METITADVYHITDEDYYPLTLEEGEEIDLSEHGLGELTVSKQTRRKIGKIPQVNRRVIEKTVIENGSGDYVSVYKNSLNEKVEYDGEELDGIFAAIVYHGKEPLFSSITEFNRALLELGVVKVGLIPEKRIRLYKTT